jgi:hypothetical protein
VLLAPRGGATAADLHKEYQASNSRKAVSNETFNEDVLLCYAVHPRHGGFVRHGYHNLIPVVRYPINSTQPEQGRRPLLTGRRIPRYSLAIVLHPTYVYSQSRRPTRPRHSSFQKSIKGRLSALRIPSTYSLECQVREIFPITHCSHISTSTPTVQSVTRA